MRFQNYRISFCIISMNRLHHLKETLPKNILDNKEYDNLEFVVLDYNSTDGMEEWMKVSMSKYILSGKIVYYHTFDPQVFSHSHSKNVAFKLASGDIVCNINADHFTGFGFAKYVNKKFNQNSNLVLTTIDYPKTRYDYQPSIDVLGKVCVRKTDFLKVNGFDEKMVNYGFEDLDFVKRIELNNISRSLIDDPSFLRFIPHDDTERFHISEAQKKSHKIYIRYFTPSKSEILLLYEDYCFQRGTLIDNSNFESENYMYAHKLRNYDFKFNLASKWKKGSWRKTNNLKVIILESEENNNLTVLRSDERINILIDEDNSYYYEVDNYDTIETVLNFDLLFKKRSIIQKNLAIMEKNLELQNTVNLDGYGRTSVLKNFELFKYISI